MMDCAQYQYWLENQTVLNRDDERELERHLTVCPACRQVEHAMLRYEAGILALQRITHSVTDEGAVDRIMGAAQMTSRLRPRGHGFQVDQVINVITEPVIRYVTGALIVLILALFTFQEVYTQHQLSQLAQRLEQLHSGRTLTTKYEQELIRWRQTGNSRISDLLSTPVVTSPAGEAFKQFLNQPDVNEIPLIWRFRYGKKYSQQSEKCLRQLLR